MNLTTQLQRGRRRLVPALQITSMVDVIFLLLVYFLTTSTYAPPESELSPALRAEQIAGGRAADLQPQIVEVTLRRGEPAFVIGERVLRDKGALRQVLEKLPKEGGVFVRGADAVTTEWAVAAIQAARDAGFEKVTYVPSR